MRSVSSLVIIIITQHTCARGKVIGPIIIVVVVVVDTKITKSWKIGVGQQIECSMPPNGRKSMSTTNRVFSPATPTDAMCCFNALVSWTQLLDQGKEFERSNQISALAQSYDSLAARMQQHHWLLYKLNHWPASMQPYWPIRSDIYFSTVVSARAPRAGQTKEMVQIHQTLFPRER